MTQFIATMPKAELHVHLEGTLEPDLSFALAQKNGVVLPYESPEALLAAYDFHDLPSFLAIYYKAMEVLRDESDFYELTWRYLKKAHDQNVVYAEMFFDSPCPGTGGGRIGRRDPVDPVLPARPLG
jgi:adenosine deaminase